MIYRSCPAVALAKEESSRSYAKGKMSGKLEVENYSLTTSSDYVFLFVASWLRVRTCLFVKGWCFRIPSAVNPPPHITKGSTITKGSVPLSSVPLLSLAPCMGRGFF
jgi:hypothetical protein